MAIAKGTPLLGVMPELLMLDTPAAGAGTTSPLEDELRSLLRAAEGPGSWDIRLGLRLLREMADPQTPWRAYLNSLPQRPAAPLLWSTEQLDELQSPAMKRAVEAQVDRLRRFHEGHMGGGGAIARRAALPAFTTAVACAASRAVEVGSGRWALVPVLDLVGPPAGHADQMAAAASSAQGQPDPAAGGPACELVVEDGAAGGGPTLILYAARDLKGGEALSRDVGLTGDDLLLRHGLTAPMRAGDTVEVVACMVDAGERPWQVQAARRLVPTSRPGRLPGDLAIPGVVRCPVAGEDDLSEVIGDSIVQAAYIMSASSQDELDEEELRFGLGGLYGPRRQACLRAVGRLLKGCRGEFATSAEEDVKLLGKLEGNRRVAAAYRLQKKRIIDVVQGLVEQAEAKAKQTGGLPFAVTGMRG